jgi:hypothetical protein
MAADESDPLNDQAKRRKPRPGRAPAVIEGEVVGPRPDPEPEVSPTVEPEAPAPGPASAPMLAAASPYLPLAAALLGAFGLGAGLYGAYEARQSDDAIMDLRAEVVALRARANATSPDQLSAFDQRLATLEQKPPAPPSAALGQAEARALMERVAAVEAAVKAAGDSARLAQQTAARAAEAGARPIPPPVDLQPLETRLQMIDKRLAAMETGQAPVAALARRAEAAGLAVVAQSITRAIDQGAPFEPALVAAVSLGADGARLAPLRAVAKTGVPTASALARLWASESRAALDATRPPESDQGWLDRLKAEASRVVRVRPVGEAPGEDPPALAGAIDAALARGAVAEALAAWTRLPEPAMTASRTFGEAARLRVAAQEAASTLTLGAISDLARSKGAP